MTPIEKGEIPTSIYALGDSPVIPSIDNFDKAVVQWGQTWGCLLVSVEKRKLNHVVGITVLIRC